MNPQPVSLADELRKVVEDWKGEAKRIHTLADKERSKAGKDALMAQSVRYWMCADELSALLDQHAVAEPHYDLPKDELLLMNLVSHLRRGIHKHKDEKWAKQASEYLQRKGIVGNILRSSGEDEPSIAHAAEQPKLTEEQVRTVTDAAIDKLENIFYKMCVARGGSANGSLTWAEINAVFDEFDANAALLTSPVAPPSQTGQCNCKYGLDGSLDKSQCARHNTLAPGEQPPRICGERMSSNGRWLCLLPKGHEGQHSSHPPHQRRNGRATKEKTLKRTSSR